MWMPAELLVPVVMLTTGSVAVLLSACSCGVGHVADSATHRGAVVAACFRHRCPPLGRHRFVVPFGADVAVFALEAAVTVTIVFDVDVVLLVAVAVVNLRTLGFH